MSGWYWVLLPAMSAWVALLESDAVLVGQFMFSRPILLGPLLGILTGNLTLGLSVGVLAELFSLEVLPVGTVMPINGSVAAGCAVLMSVGPDVVPLAASFPAGLGLGAGHRALESHFRQRRSEMGLRVLDSLEEEGRVDWEGILLQSIGTQVLMTGVFVYAAVAAVGPLLSFIWGVAPVSSREGMEFGLRAAPSIGLAAIGFSLYRKK